MYPRNAASPEPISIGAVVQISDGAVQTSGVTVRIKPVGVAEGDGAGTTSYSTDGVVIYTPTHAETNYTSFVVVAKKTGCIPVAVTVVTTAESTAGKVSLGGSQTANITGNITGNLSGSVGSVTGNVGGNVTGSVGSLATQAKADVNAEVDQAITDAALATASALSTAQADLDIITGADGVTLATAQPNYTPATAAALDAVDNFIDTEIADIQSRLPAALVGGRMDSSVGAMATGVLTATAIAADAITAAKVASDTLDEIAAAVRDISNASPAAGSLGENIKNALADTNELQADWADGGRLDLVLDARASQTSVDTIDNFLDTEIAAILEDTGTTLPAQIAAITTTQLTEGYAADGVAPTLEEATFMILQSLHEFAITGTSRTAKKLDGTTTAMVFTLDSDTAPTSTTRSA